MRERTEGKEKERMKKKKGQKEEKKAESGVAVR